jgi:hypothetical protein
LCKVELDVWEQAMPVPTVAVEMMIWAEKNTDQSIQGSRKLNPLLHELTLENPLTGVFAASQRIDALNRASSSPELTDWTRETLSGPRKAIHPALWKAAAVANLDSDINAPATEFDCSELKRLALKFAGLAGSS